ncbi:glycosyltransferase [Rufibacter glacialis]|uniref:Glycosyltransferase n=1 Tax=Rufibacter glacialis TaxID=1259555 RepID=A0A5M8QBE6_9BACT|nr:glycosyltransferase [Rufibacter glacialis]KAA6432371.1 glycosyltransferase [Rufibacter glacialis]GGK78159.1 hypothetical protein GCM10011405_27430 [Rufibacter glacialis]
MEFTGERFVPTTELLTDEIGIEHLHRYETCVGFVNNKDVLDIACGVGYGSALFAKNARTVIGIDIDSISIEYATQTYSSHNTNLRFLTGSVAKIPLPDNSIDVVVSFETIEHVDEPTQHAFLQEVKRVLRNNGSLIISTPDRANYSERYNYVNEFHIKEFNAEEFQRFLSRYFTNIEFFSQGFEIISAITPVGSTQLNQVKVCDLDLHSPSSSKKYLLSVCSNIVQQEALQLSSVVFNTGKDYLEITDTIVEKEAHILELGAWGKSLDKHIAEKDNLILSMQEELELKAAYVLALQSENQKKSLELSNAKAANDLQLEKLTELGKSILQLQEGIQNATSKNTSLQQELEDKDNIITSQKQKLHSLYNQIDNLNGRLNEIYVSEGWKLLSLYYGVKGRLLKEDTKRYKLVKKVVNKLRGKTESSSRIMASTNTTELSAPTSLLKEPDVVSYDPITLPKYAQPLVSIIIPVYNAWEMNYRCIKAIQRNSLGVSYEVIIGDDCSTDETKEIDSYIENLVSVRNEVNLGFLQNCNHAATFAKGKYLIFLNNDTEVKEGWLTALTDLMERDITIGLAGSKLIYPNGRLQEAGGIIWDDASGWNYGHKQDPDAPEFNYVKEVDYVSGASIIIRSELWKELGGFDIRYTPAYCEDSDLAFAIRKKGFKVVYQPLSEVIHYEGYSHGNDREQSAISSIKEYQKINNTKFFEKWILVLQKDQFPNAENVFWARDRSKGKKTILMIDHYVPQFDKDAGSRTTFGYLELLVNMGFNVKFLGDNFYQHEPYTTVLQQMSIEVLYGPWYRDNWQQWFKDNSDKFDYVYLNRPHISIKYIEFIKQHSKALILYYGHDLHYLREQKRYELEKDPSILKGANKWKETETYLFDHSDVILTPSEEEKKIIGALNPNYNVQVIRPFIYNTLNEPVVDFASRKDILFVGGFGHMPNVDGVIWFVKEVWPLVKQQIPDAKFIIIGSNPPEQVKQLANEDVIFKGFVSDEELERTYKEVKLVVVPLRYGAGVKGKLVEAMHYGVPLVTTSEGIDGLPGDVSFIVPANNPVQLSEQVIEYYLSNEKLVKLSNLETNYIREYFFKDAAKEVLKDILTMAT